MIQYAQLILLLAGLGLFVGVAAVYRWVNYGERIAGVAYIASVLGLASLALVAAAIRMAAT